MYEVMVFMMSLGPIGTLASNVGTSGLIKRIGMNATLAVRSSMIQPSTYQYYTPNVDESYHNFWIL